MTSASRRRLAVVSALAGAALLLPASPRHALAHTDGPGGHGHGPAHGFAAGEPAEMGKATRVVEIVMSEGPGTMSYSPSRIEVRKGELIRLVLRNAGQLRHEILIDSFENNARHKAEMAENPDMAHEEPNGRHVEPGKSAELLWRFTKAGTFEYACLIPGHYESGMKGVIVVK
jgi:uncharacterized cupredoxin-like copper-binding protein